MFTFCANKVNLKKLTGEVLTAGAAGIYTCQFDLSADWSGLAVKAIFRAGGTEKQVDVADGSCQIPWEVLREEGDILSVGLYGENQEREVVLPTIWADLGRIMPAANLEGVTLPPTPSIAEQALEEIRQNAESAAASRQAAATSEENAAASAEEAKKVAEKMDMETILSAISAKGDNLWVDPVTNLLYLTSGGEKIGDGVSIVTGGGGGGGGMDNNAVISLVNTTGWIYKTLAHGAPCPISATATSLEEGMQTGALVLKVSVNNVVKSTMEIPQGDLTVDVGPWLDVGACVVKLNVTDTYGNSRTLNFNITTVKLILESPFDATVPYIGEIIFPYVPTAAAEKTMHFWLDGVEIGTDTVVASGRQQSFTIPAQAHGSHYFEVYFDATVDGETVTSDPLRYDLMCLEAGNTTPIISVPFWETTVEQFGLVNIPYIVYNPASLTSDIVQAANGETVKELTVDRTLQTWNYRPEAAGALALSIACGNAEPKVIELTVTESKLNVEAETEALALYLNTYGRSNNESDPAVWESGDIAANLTGFNWASDGWQQDEDGVTVLRVSGDARVEIPYQIFAKDFRTTGKTIEVEFATRDVLNYDAPVITCWSGERGLKITAQRADIRSEQSSIGTQYKENEHVRLAFVVEKRTAHRLLLVYINGILSGAVQYPTDDDFSQASPVGISIGSNDCTTDVYCIRVYDNDLTRYQVLDNWIADTQVLSLKAERYQRNNVYDDYGQIVIAKLPSDLPYMVLNAAKLPEYKGNKITVRGSYTDLMDPAKSFTFEGAQADVQGTSSAGYARKNYKIKYKGGFDHDGKHYEVYQLGDGVPTSVFTYKADVASSEGANNVELVKLYCDICPFKTPPQLLDSRVRQGIDGYPMVIFQNNGAETVFIGKYNFNNDKGTPEVFGFDSDDESWETKNNTSARALWKSADFSGTDWTNDFEARHPEDNTDVSNLQTLAAWIVSTDTEQATGEALDSAVTYGDVEYTHDTAEYRLAKFDAELGDWFDEDSTIFYYLFTELFLMTDSRTKNSFPTRYDGGKWCWLPYDMDTAMGIDNMGVLSFGYELEDIDTVEGDPVYNGQASVIWKNLRATRFDQIKAMYQQLRSDELLTYEDVERRFERHQAKWPEAIFNEDAYYKYLEPLFRDGTGSYLTMLQGSKAEQRKWWLYNRFRYMDSKYLAGDAQKDFITVRGYAKSDITVTPYADIYAAILFGSYLVQKRALRSEGSQTLEYPMETAKETETYIYSASQLADIGDLSGYEVGYADFSAGTKLQSIKLGDADTAYRNLHLDTLYLGNNVLLKTLDVRNCPNLGTGEQKSVDISGCTNIEHIYFDGTSIAGLTLPNGGIIKTLHLPGTVTNLTIRNQPGITDFFMPGYSNITTLRLEGVSNVVPGFEILSGMPAASRVRLVGFDYSFDSAAQILAMMDRLDTMRGLDENGGNVNKAQVSGIVRVELISEDQLLNIEQRYSDVLVIYESLFNNLLHYVAWENGMINGNTGADINVEGWIRTLYFDISKYAGETIAVVTDTTQGARLAVYDENKVNIQAAYDMTSDDPTIFEIELSASAKYARLSMEDENDEIYIVKREENSLEGKDETVGYYNATNGQFENDARYRTKRIEITGGEVLFSYDTASFVFRKQSGDYIAGGYGGGVVRLPEGTKIVDANYAIEKSGIVSVHRAATIGYYNNIKEETT